MCFAVGRVAGGFAYRGAARFLFTPSGFRHHGCDLAEAFSPVAVVFLGRSLLRRDRQERLSAGPTDSELPPSISMDFSALSGSD